MEPGPALPPSMELHDSVRAFAVTLAQTLQARGALFSLELSEELRRGKRLLLLGLLAGGLLHMALLALTGLIVVAFWDTHRLDALAAAFAVYLASATAACLMLRACLAANHEPFAASLQEMRRDLAALGPPQ